VAEKGTRKKVLIMNNPARKREAGKCAEKKRNIGGSGRF